MNTWRVKRFGEDDDYFYATNGYTSLKVYYSFGEAYNAGVKIFSKFGFQS